MSRILDESLLTTFFNMHNVSEVYAVEGWQYTKPKHLYVVMKDTSLTASLLRRLINDCTEEYRLSATMSPDAPMLMNKKLIWFRGEWRDSL